MTAPRRAFLRQVMQQAWTIYRLRATPGCNVRTFGDALRNAWAWLARKALPALRASPTLHLRSALQSPTRRHVGGLSYAYAGRVTSSLGR